MSRGPAQDPPPRGRPGEQAAQQPGAVAQAEEPQQAARRHIGVERPIFRQVAQALARFLGLVLHIVAGDASASGVGLYALSIFSTAFLLVALVAVLAVAILASMALSLAAGMRWN